MSGVQQPSATPWKTERGEGCKQDADLLLDMSDNIGGKSLCALGDAAIGPGDLVGEEVPRRVPASRRAQQLPAGDETVPAIGHAGGSALGTTWNV